MEDLRKEILEFLKQHGDAYMPLSELLKKYNTDEFTGRGMASINELVNEQCIELENSSDGIHEPEYDVTSNGIVRKSQRINPMPSYKITMKGINQLKAMI